MGDINLNNQIDQSIDKYINKLDSLEDKLDTVINKVSGVSKSKFEIRWS